MVSWGVEVNDYGNAIFDDAGNFKKVKGEGLSEELWAEMVAYAEGKGWKKGDYKKLNLPFEMKILAQPKAVRERMYKGVEDFVYGMLATVMNAEGTASIARDIIAEAGGYDLGPKAAVSQKAADWTKEKILERAKALGIGDKGPAGNFDD